MSYDGADVLHVFFQAIGLVQGVVFHVFCRGSDEVSRQGQVAALNYLCRAWLTVVALCDMQTEHDEGQAIDPGVVVCGCSQCILKVPVPAFYHPVVLWMVSQCMAVLGSESFKKIAEKGRLES